MKDFAISVNKHCPCAQNECPILGNCVLCVQNHLVKKHHLPECMQNILRPSIEFLAKQVQYDTEDQRPTKEHWENYDKDGLIERSLNNHKK